MKTHAFHAGFQALPPAGKVVPVSTTAAVPEGMTAVSSGVVEKSLLGAITFAPI